VTFTEVIAVAVQLENGGAALWQRLIESPQVVAGFVVLVVAMLGALAAIVKLAARTAVNATELRLKKQRVELEAKIADNEVKREVKRAEAFTDQAVMRTMTESAFNMSTIMQQLVEMQKTTQNQIGEIQRAYITESAAWREVVIENRDEIGALKDTTRNHHTNQERVIQKLIERIERLLEKIQKIIDIRNRANEHETPKHDDVSHHATDAGTSTPGDGAGRYSDEHNATNGNGDEPAGTNGNAH
jgi:hypothetical protein